MAGNPLDDQLSGPHLHGSLRKTPPRKREKLPPTDLEYEDWKHRLQRSLYGPESAQEDPGLPEVPEDP